MTAAPMSKNYATPRFQVVIDGHPLTAFVKSVEGGLLKVDPVTEPSGPTNVPSKHIATRSIDPISIEVGMCGSNWLLQIVESVVNNQTHTRLNGHIHHADANTSARFEQQFTRAMVTEIGFPSMDATSKEFVFLKVKMQPETAKFSALGVGPKLSSEMYPPQKLWTTSAFRLNLELNGRKIDCERTTKIEAFTLKVGSKVMQTGSAFLPTYMPTKIEIPKLSFTMPLHYATDAINWFRDATARELPTLADGSSVGGGYEATGSIEFLDPSRTKTLYTINLDGVGPEQFSISKTEASSTNTKTCKFDLYVKQMKMKG
jgi:hypothetical protein